MAVLREITCLMCGPDIPAEVKLQFKFDPGGLKFAVCKLSAYMYFG